MNDTLGLLAWAALGLAVVGVWLAGAWAAVRTVWFVRRARRVPGRVVSESRFRPYGGLPLRFYRVQVPLSTGQSVLLRSTALWAGIGPAVGEAVPALVLERPGQGPQARIATGPELWGWAAALLSLGTVGLGIVLMIGAQWLCNEAQAGGRCAKVPAFCVISERH